MGYDYPGFFPLFLSLFFGNLINSRNNLRQLDSSNVFESVVSVCQVRRTLNSVMCEYWRDANNKFSQTRSLSVPKSVQMSKILFNGDWEKNLQFCFACRILVHC